MLASEVSYHIQVRSSVLRSNQNTNSYVSKSSCEVFASDRRFEWDDLHDDNEKHIPVFITKQRESVQSKIL